MPNKFLSTAIFRAKMWMVMMQEMEEEEVVCMVEMWEVEFGGFLLFGGFLIDFNAWWAFSNDDRIVLYSIVEYTLIDSLDWEL